MLKIVFLRRPHRAGFISIEVSMPYVNVRITKDGVTTEQKKQIVEEITHTLVKVLGKKPEHTHIIIDEVEPENWGFAGMLTTEYRQQK
jgi:4-oxalocrotonate tautomerase